MQFLNNFASGNTKKMTINAYGGVVYGNETCVLNFTECIFDSNYVCDPFPAYKTFSHFFGGGIYLSYCELCLINCDLVNNSAYLNAIRPASLNGASCYAGFAYLDSTNSTFKNFIFYNYSAITMIDYYSNSSPSCYGGVIYTSHFSYDNIPVYLNLTKCEFINNKAYVTHHGSSYGGAISTDSILYLESCTFINNSAFTKDVSHVSDGGAIALYNTGIINKCKFTNSLAINGAEINYAGSNFFSSGSFYLNISNCVFQETYHRNFLYEIFIYY